MQKLQRKSHSEVIWAAHNRRLPLFCGHHIMPQVQLDNWEMLQTQAVPCSVVSWTHYTDRKDKVTPCYTSGQQWPLTVKRLCVLCVFFSIFLEFWVILRYITVLCNFNRKQLQLTAFIYNIKSSFGDQNSWLLTKMNLHWMKQCIKRTYEVFCCVSKMADNRLMSSCLFFFRYKAGVRMLVSLA